MLDREYQRTPEFKVRLCSWLRRSPGARRQVQRMSPGARRQCRTSAWFKICAGLLGSPQTSILEFARGLRKNHYSSTRPHSPCRRAHVWQWQWRASRRGFWAKLARDSHATVTQRPRRCEDGICCGIAPAVPRLPLHMAVNAQFRAHHLQVL
jgi:hypothetical protein